MRIAIAALVCIATPGAALAQERDDQREALRYEIAFQALNLADLAITLDCVNRNVCHEANPIFGRNPSDRELIFGKALGGAVHWLIFDHLRERDPRAARLFSQASVALQGGVVMANLRFTF